MQNTAAVEIEGAVHYDLVGVVTHRGTFDAGHYFCFARNPTNERDLRNRWFRLDDNNVKDVSAAQVRAAAASAYVLFYRKIE